MQVAALGKAEATAAAERLAFGESGGHAAPLQLTPKRLRRGAASHRDELTAKSARSRTGDGRQRSTVERLRDTLDTLLRLERTRQLSTTEDWHGQTSCLPSWMRGSPCPLDSSKCAHAVQLGCDILQFPFAPMPPQLAVAERALLACERGGIAMLQSPTGTGKSLALLSATLAWQRRCFAKRGAAPQILYGVRTHSQLAQMVRELRKSPYRPRMAIIGSREQLCANEQVKSQAKSKGVPLNLACRQACRRAVQDSMFQRRSGSRGGFGMQGHDQLGCSCNMYTSLAEVRHASRVFHKCSKSGTIWDIEDLFEASGTSISNASNNAAGCPYYTSHILAGTADIVFCPHNYIMDPAVSKCRTHHRERWSLEGRVIIIDEAHNLEQCCREAGSLQVKLQELRQLTTSLRSLPSRHPRFRFSVGGRSLSCAEACALLERVPLQLASFLEAQAQQRPQAATKSNSHTTEPCPLSSQMQDVWGLPGRPHTADFLGRAGLSGHHLLSQSTEDLILEVTDKILQVQLENETIASEQREAAAIRARETCAAEDAALLMVLDKLMELIFKLRLASRHPDSYVMGIKAEASAARASAASLNVWLMAPGVIFEVFTAPAHAVLLASGTLAPMGALGAELSNSPALAARALREGPLEAFHVVQPHQLLAAVVPCFLSSGQRAVSTFGCWQSPDFLSQLGETIVLLVATIPGGILCFFPSYQSLESAVESWKHATTWQMLKDLKGVVVVEPRGAGNEMSKACATFTSGVASGSGALCLAVYRGKMSEGLDFADDLCRGVICIGVPYPQTNDPVVLAKRKWNDARRCSVTSESKWLSGKQWYELQAHRAINQALGRLLRHHRDYGALVLLDARWASRGDCARGLHRHLSKWLQPHLCEWPTTNKELVGKFRDRLKRHFDEAKQLVCREAQTHAAAIANVWPATDTQPQSSLKAKSNSQQPSSPPATHHLQSSSQWSNVWPFSQVKKQNDSVEPARIASITHTLTNSTTSASIGICSGASSSNNICRGDDNGAAPTHSLLGVLPQVQTLDLKQQQNPNSNCDKLGVQDSVSDADTEHETNVDSDSSCVCLGDVQPFERERSMQQSTTPEGAQQKIPEQSNHALLLDRPSDEEGQCLDTSQQPAAGWQGRTSWLGISTTVRTPPSSLQSAPPDMPSEGKVCLKRPCPFPDPVSFASKTA
jgi:DNA repair helicase Rad3